MYLLPLLLIKIEAVQHHCSNVISLRNCQACMRRLVSPTAIKKMAATMLIRHYTCWLIVWWFSESKRDIRALRLQTTCKSNICFANIKHDHIMHHKYIIISTKVSVCNSLQKNQMGMDFTPNICSVIF